MSTKIPKVFHQIWLGGKPLPSEFKDFQGGWLSHHPGWRLQLWTHENLPALINDECFAGSRTYAGRANVLRYELLLRHGGVYVDTDFECRRNIEPLLDDVECFAGRQWDEKVNNAIFGSVPNHPFVRDLVDSLPAHTAYHHSAPSVSQSGPYYFSRVLRRHPEVAVFGPNVFYPYEWHERWRRHESFPDAYAVHHYTLSARRADAPRRAEKRLNDGSLHVLLTPPRGHRPDALEWVLEGLCSQTQGDFTVSLLDGSHDKTITSLLGRFASRLRIGSLPEQDGVEAERVLLLDGDCVPDADVIEAHAAFGDRSVVAYGFRRLYPATKLYPYRAPLDRPGLKWHARPDPRQAHPLRPIHRDWRDVLASCFSLPARAVNRRALLACGHDGRERARRLLAHPGAEALPGMPLWPKAGVTSVLADDPAPTPAGTAFEAQTVLYGGASRSARRRARAICLEVVADDKDRGRVDAWSPPLAFIRLGDAGGAQANGPSAQDEGDPDAFIGADRRRFHFRLTDPFASNDTLRISWYTLLADRTADDRPECATLTLVRTRPESSVFVSPSVIVVPDDRTTDPAPRRAPGAVGSAVGPRPRPNASHRLRRADLSGAVKAQYWPAAGAPPVSVCVPVCRRSPDERRRLEVQLVAYGDVPAAAMTTGLSAAARELARLGVRLDLGPLRSRPLPRHAAASGLRTEADNGSTELVLPPGLATACPPHVVTVVFTPLHAGPASRCCLSLAHDDRRCLFVDVASTRAVPAFVDELVPLCGRYATALASGAGFAGRP